MRRILFVGGLAAAAMLAWQLFELRPATYPDWSEAQIAMLESLSLEALPPLPADPSNAVANDPAAAAFGEALFSDPRMSANGAISCATCHQPIRRFTDGLPKGVALGVVDRNTPSIVGTAYSPWQFWDGRRDSQWAQALAPLQDSREHGVTRRAVADLVRDDADYRRRYETLFGELPALRDAAAVDTVFANVGKVLAAFQRTVLPTPAPFDDYVAALRSGGDGRDVLSADEAQGLRIFVGKAECTQCHNGPLLTNNEFHNTGVRSAPGEVPDIGRAGATDEVLADPFNCRGEFSDDAARQCPELDFMRSGVELVGAFRTPSLRNLQDTAPFMHKGQIASLGEVLRHYNEAPDAMIGHNEAEPLGLTRRELRQLEAFLHTLAAPATR